MLKTILSAIAAAAVLTASLTPIGPLQAQEKGKDADKQQAKKGMDSQDMKEMRENMEKGGGKKK